MKALITITIWLTILTTAVLAIGLLFVDYDTFCHIILSSVGALGREHLFKTTFLPLHRFGTVQFIGVAILLVIETVALLLLKKVDSLLHVSTLITKTIQLESMNWKHFILRLSSVERWALAAIVFGGWLSTLYFAVTMPVAVDESLTYLYCTRFSVFVSGTYYALPNNHIFFSILTNLTSQLPFDALFNLRLPNILLVGCTNLLFFRYVSRFFSPSIALICLGVFTFSFMNFFYSFQGRGYEIVLFTSLIIIYCATIVTERAIIQRRYFLYFSLASIVGFYTLPSFLYVFTPVTLFTFYSLYTGKNYSALKQLLLSISIIIFCVVCLYVPVILVSGLGSVIANPYSIPIPRMSVVQQLIPHFQDISSWILGIPNRLLALLVLVFLTTILIHRAMYETASTHLKLLGTLIISAPIEVVLHSVIAFPRTWIFLTIPAIISIGYILKYIPQRLITNPVVYIPVILLITIGLLASFTSVHLTTHPGAALEFCMDNLLRGQEVSQIKSIGYEDINCADILKYHVVTANNNSINPQLISTDSLECYSSDVIVLSNGTPNYAALALNKYSIISTSEGECGMMLIKKK